ncbi:MAG TPA: hypothetical protein VEQ66_16410 [Propionibacteriaceae bacterium]|nr:hypothetical protein [Propionibacteriaceae bacterium]
MTARRARTRLAHAVLICVGLAILLYPLTVGANPTISCRGVRLQPGQSCAKADSSAAQTYEQRRRTAVAARPVIIGVGLLVAVFGAVLLAGDLRASRESDDPGVEDRSGVG